MSETLPKPTPPPGPRIQPTMMDGLTVKDIVNQVKRFFRFLKKYWLLLMVGSVLGGIAGVLTVFLLPSKAAATFQIRLVPRFLENPVARYERQNTEFFRSAEQTFNSSPLITLTLKSLGETTPTEAQIFSIERNLSFYPIGEHVYQGRFTSRDAKSAFTFLSSHVAMYLETEISKTLRGIQGEADFLTKKIKETDKELRDSEVALQEFREKHADGLPELAREHYYFLRQVQQAKIEVQAKLDQTRLELKLNKEKLAGEKLFVESKVISSQRAQPYQDAMVRAQKDMAEARASELSDDHPEIKRLTALVGFLKELNEQAQKTSDTEIERTRNPIFESIQDAVYQLEVQEEVARTEYDQITTNLKQAESIVAALPELQKVYAELNRNYGVTQQFHAKLLEQLQVAQTQLDLERASVEARYDIIVPPSIEYTSITKKLIARMILLALGGFLVGISIAIVAELKPYVI
ncbi:MAG: hypothetical protein WCK47_00870 [bacterium]